LLFLYRYAFLLGSQSLAMSQARDLRSCGRGLPLSTYGPLVGPLLLRTLDRAERIHQAMCCRGFRGDVPIGNTLAWRWVDAVFLAGWCLCFAVLRWGWLVEGLGGFLLGAQP
jgi:cobalt/nickel transport system permease protein